MRKTKSGRSFEAEALFQLGGAATLSVVVLGLAAVTGSASELSGAAILRTVVTAVLVFPFLWIALTPLTAPSQVSRPMLSLPLGLIGVGLCSGVLPIPEFFLSGETHAIGATEVLLRVGLFGLLGLWLGSRARASQHPKSEGG